MAGPTWWSLISGTATHLLCGSSVRVAGNGKSHALVITEAHEVDPRIWALGLGVSDHLAAPFATREAFARVEHLIAQQRMERPLRLVAGDLTVDLAQRSAVRNGKRVALTPRESACS